MSEIRTATAADLPTVSAVLADAFVDDPVMSWAFPDLETRPRLLAAMFGFLAEHQYLAHGVSVVGDDCAALWRPMGGSSDEGDFWERHGMDFAVVMDGQLERLGAVGAVMGEHHPGDEHRYLLSIGVRPSAQGRGLGGRLLDHTLTETDSAGVATYLEASSRRSRVLYERHGFEVTSEFSADGSPPLWGMWREPR